MSALAISPTTLPSNPQVTVGQASVTQSGATMTIAQSTAQAAINWNSFSIGRDGRVNIVQPNAQSILFNRVTGSDPSKIWGQISANGEVILLNPNGIVMERGSGIWATSFTASTFELSDLDFLNGQYRYNRNNAIAGITIRPGASLSTQQTPNGYIALISSRIQNQGQLRTQGGAVVMAAGERVSLPSDLSIALNGKVNLEITPAQIQTSIQNDLTSVITTQGGQVYVQAASVVDMISGQAGRLTQLGLIDTSAARGGDVTLLAPNGQIQVQGVVCASSTNAQQPGGCISIGRDPQTQTLAQQTDVSNATLSSVSGWIETSGEKLLTEGVKITASTWLLDPTDVIISSAAPSGMTGMSNMTSTTSGNTTSYVNTATLASALASGTNVTISTVNANGTMNGDIGMTSSLSVAVAANLSPTLTLQATRDINISAAITETGAGKLNVILNSNTGNNGGSVVLQTANISSNGGNILLGGGSNGNATGMAQGSDIPVGVYMLNSTLNAGAGNISLLGRGITNVSALSFTGYGSLPIGVYIIGSQVIATGNGSIAMNGVGGAYNGSYAHGLFIDLNTCVTVANGSMQLNGTSGGATGVLSAGVKIADSTNVMSTGSANITINAIGNATTSNTGIGLLVASNSNLTLSGTGSLSITGNDVSTLGTGAGVSLKTNGIIKSNNGTISISTNNFANDGTATLSAGTSGTINLNTLSTGVGIDIGGSGVAGYVNPVLGISNVSLSHITAGTLNIGNASASLAITSTAAVAAASMSKIGVVNVYTAGNTLLNNANWSMGNTSLNFMSTGGLSMVNTSINTQYGSLNLTSAGSASNWGLSLDSASSLVSTNSNITIATDTLNEQGKINAGSSGTVTLKSLNGNVDLGSSNTIGANAAALAINSGALGNITANKLVINSPGNLSISQNVSYNGATVANLWLNHTGNQFTSTGNITQYGSGNSSLIIQDNGNGWGAQFNGGIINSGSGLMNVTMNESNGIALNGAVSGNINLQLNNKYVNASQTNGVVITAPINVSNVNVQSTVINAGNPAIWVKAPITSAGNITLNSDVVNVTGASVSNALWVTQGADLTANGLIALNAASTAQSAGNGTYLMTIASNITTNSGLTLSIGANGDNGVMGQGGIGVLNTSKIVSNLGLGINTINTNTPTYWAANLTGQAMLIAANSSLMVDANLNLSGPTSVSSYASLIMLGNGSLAGGNYSGTLALSNGATLQWFSGVNQTLSGVLSGSGVVLKGQYDSTLTFAANNTWTGGAVVNQGALQAASANAWGTGNITVNPLGTADFHGNSLNNAIALWGGTLTNSASTTVNNSGTVYQWANSTVTGVGNLSTTWWSAPNLVLNQQGSNSVMLNVPSNVTSYVGDFVVNSGSLGISATGASTTSYSGNVTIGPNASFVASGSGLNLQKTTFTFDSSGGGHLWLNAGVSTSASNISIQTQGGNTDWVSGDGLNQSPNSPTTSWMSVLVAQGNTAQDLVLSAPINGMSTLNISGNGVVSMASAQTTWSHAWVNVDTAQVWLPTASSVTAWAADQINLMSSARWTYAGSSNATLASNVTGGGQISVNAGGTLILSGRTNQLNATLNVSQGGIELVSAGDLQVNETVVGSGQAWMVSTAGNVTLNGALSMTDASSVNVTATGSITQNAAANWQAGHVNLQANQSSQLRGALNVTQSLSLSGPGSWVLAGQTSLNGSLTVTNTSVQLGDGSSNTTFQYGQGAVMLNHGQLNYNTASANVINQTVSGNGVLMSNNDLIFNQAIEVNASTGANTLSIQTTSNASSVSAGNITVSGGIFNNSTLNGVVQIISNNGVLLDSAVTASQAKLDLTVQANGQATGVNTSSGLILAGGGAINTNGGNLTLSGTHSGQGPGGEGVLISAASTPLKIQAGQVQMTGQTASPGEAGISVQNDLQISTTQGGITFQAVNAESSTASVWPTKVGALTLAGNLTFAATSSGAPAQVLLSGTSAGNGEYGVWMGASNAASSALTLVSGKLLVNGQGGMGGIGVNQSQWQINGDLTLQGQTSGGTYVANSALDYASGVSLASNTQVSVHGNVLIQGEQTAGSQASTARGVVLAGVLNNTAGTTVIHANTSGIELAASAQLTQSASAGVIQISAGDGTTTSLASIRLNDVTSALPTRASTQIIQLGSAGVSVTTDGQGDLTIPKILNQGTGQVLVGAGIQNQVGQNASGGNLKTVSGYTIENAQGHTFLLTGNVNQTDALSQVDPALSTLYFSSVGQTSQNAQAEFGYAQLSQVTTSAGHTWVGFRSNMDFGAVVNGATSNLTYGDAQTTQAAISLANGLASVKQSVLDQNTATIFQTASAGTLAINPQALLANSTWTVQTPMTMSDAGYLSVGQYQLGMSSADPRYQFGMQPNQSIQLRINPRTITSASIADVKVTQGQAGVAGAVTMGSDVIAGDQVKSANAAQVTMGPNMTLASLAAGQYDQSVSGGLSGADSNNYVFYGLTSSGKNYVVIPVTNNTPVTTPAANATSSNALLLASLNSSMALNTPPSISNSTVQTDLSAIAPNTNPNTNTTVAATSDAQALPIVADSTPVSNTPNEVPSPNSQVSADVAPPATDSSISNASSSSSTSTPEAPSSSVASNASFPSNQNTTATAAVAVTPSQGSTASINSPLPTASIVTQPQAQVASPSDVAAVGSSLNANVVAPATTTSSITPAPVPLAVAPLSPVNALETPAPTVASVSVMPAPSTATEVPSQNSQVELE